MTCPLHLSCELVESFTDCWWLISGQDARISCFVNVPVVLHRFIVLVVNLRVILQFHRCVTSTFLKQVLLKVASALILVTSGGCALKQACNCCYLVRDSFAPLFCLCINCHTVVVMMASKNDGQWHVVPLSFRSPFFVRFIIFLIFTLNKNHLLFYSSQWWVNFSRMVTSFLCVHSLKTGWQHNQPQVICHA